MITRAQAIELDEKDPLNKYVGEFVKTDSNLCYLDGNSLGPLPKKTIENINSFLLNEIKRRPSNHPVSNASNLPYQ